MAVSTTILHPTLHDTVTLHLNSDNLCSDAPAACRDNGQSIKSANMTPPSTMEDNNNNSYAFLTNMTSTVVTTTSSSTSTTVPPSATTTMTNTPKNHLVASSSSSRSVLQSGGAVVTTVNSRQPSSTTVNNSRQPSMTVKTSLKRPRNEAAAGSPPELMRCKRRINFAQLGYNLPQAQPSAVSRRNERERNRVKLVNLGFATLREHVPNGSKNKKMSKVETLRSAVEYIRKLQELLDDDGGSSVGSDGASHVDDQSPYADPSVSGSPTSHMENKPPLHGPGGTILDNMCYSQRSTTGMTCPPSSVSPTCSLASSPTPSYTSDYSYEPLSPEEEDLLDFTSWFS